MTFGGKREKPVFEVRHAQTPRLYRTEVRFQHSFLSVQVSNVPYCEALRRRSEMDLFFYGRIGAPNTV